MKLKYLLILFSCFWGGDSIAQQTDFKAKIEADIIFFKTYKAKLNSIVSAENYLYFSRGIIPAETSEILDKHLALSEENFIDTELYIRKYNFEKYLKIAGYWRNIRLKLVHSYKKELARDLDKKLMEMHRLLSDFGNGLVQKYRLGYEKKQLLVGKILYYTHYLSFLFIANETEKSPYFEKKLSATVENYRLLIESLKKTEFHDKKDLKRFQFITRLMETFLAELNRENIAPETIYELVKVIDNDTREWLKL